MSFMCIYIYIYAYIYIYIYRERERERYTLSIDLYGDMQIHLASPHRGGVFEHFLVVYTYTSY